MRPKLSRSSGVIPLLLLAPALLMGCTESGTRAITNASAPREQAPVARTAAASEAPAVFAAARENWTYTPAGKWDPFVVPSSLKIPPPGWDLDQMALRGVVYGGGMEAAYLVMPDNSGLIVRLNDELGPRGGRVSAIGSDYMVVEEMFIEAGHPERIHVVEKRLELARQGAGM
jgi:Tfp pilus assembly protein PilP